MKRIAEALTMSALPIRLAETASVFVANASTLPMMDNVCQKLLKTVGPPEKTARLLMPRQLVMLESVTALNPTLLTVVVSVQSALNILHALIHPVSVIQVITETQTVNANLGMPGTVEILGLIVLLQTVSLV